VDQPIRRLLAELLTALGPTSRRDSPLSALARAGLDPALEARREKTLSFTRALGGTSTWPPAFSEISRELDLEISLAGLASTLFEKA